MSRAAAFDMAFVRLFCEFLFVFKHGLFVVSGGFAFGERDCSRRAGGQAIAESVAIIVAKKFCFSVHHADRAFVASRSARSATVTFFFVDMNDFSFHRLSPFRCFLAVFLDFPHILYYTFLVYCVVYTTK